MDEAFASLDMERAREIEKTILGLKDMTVINVSHVIFKIQRDCMIKFLRLKDHSLGYFCSGMPSLLQAVSTKARSFRILLFRYTLVYLKLPKRRESSY